MVVVVVMVLVVEGRSGVFSGGDSLINGGSRNK